MTAKNLNRSSHSSRLCHHFLCIMKGPLSVSHVTHVTTYLWLKEGVTSHCCIARSLLWCSVLYLFLKKCCKNCLFYLYMDWNWYSYQFLNVKWKNLQIFHFLDTGTCSTLSISMSCIRNVYVKYSVKNVYYVFCLFWSLIIDEQK